MMTFKSWLSTMSGRRMTHFFFYCALKSMTVNDTIICFNIQKYTQTLTSKLILNVTVTRQHKSDWVFRVVSLFYALNMHLIWCVHASFFKKTNFNFNVVLSRMKSYLCLALIIINPKRSIRINHTTMKPHPMTLTLHKSLDHTNCQWRHSKLLNHFVLY